MMSRDLLRVLRDALLLVCVMTLSACGAGVTDVGDGEEDLGETKLELITSCPAGFPNNGGVTLIGTAAGETLTGTAGGDCIIGNAGNDTINGLGGNDYLVGGAGDDIINAGDGADTVAPETGNDTVFGGNGDDTINAQVNTGGNDILHGDAGNDYILGGNGNDQIFGEAGADLIKAYAGDDIVSGGDDNDNIEGGAGNDTIGGGNGDDKIYGQDGNDILNGELGNDFIFGGNNDDTIHGNDGADTLRGEAGIDTVNGDIGNDIIYGGTEGDILHGDLGDDIIYGEDGADQLFGDDGDDRLAGGAGVDAMSGGLGNDLFDEGGDGGSMVGGDGNDAAIQTANANGSLGTDACTGISCELAPPAVNCASGCGTGRRCAREVSFCIYCQSDSECSGGNKCVPTQGCKPVETDCSNSSDDDGDGAVDCVDTDCADSPVCAVTARGFGGGVGNWHGCVTSSGSAVSCWGRNNLCQLGFNGGGATPGAVAGISTASDVRVGSYNSCALLSGNTVQCWGASTNGALGDGGVFTGDCTKTPVTVTGLSGATQLSVGAGHACALVGGAIKCWGANGTGQLGANSTATSSSTPLSVVGISNAIQVSAGSQSTCAVLADGRVQCWGRNHRAQLGIGVTGNPSSVPVTVTGLSNIAQVAVGQDFACARAFGGTVSCWGDNASGELGRGTLGGTSGTATAISGLSGVVSLQAGAFHSCVIQQGGNVSCWGLNTDGQVGIGTTSAGQASPVATNPLVSGVALHMGRAFSCAKDSLGTTRCWGDNLYGQIAADLPTDHPTAFVKTGLPP
jgi:alpha-tubulin suppressor-like RCC1 family protein